MRVLAGQGAREDVEELTADVFLALWAHAGELNQGLSQYVRHLLRLLREATAEDGVIEVLRHPHHPAVDHRPEGGVLLPQPLPFQGQHAQHRTGQLLRPAQMQAELLGVYLAPAPLPAHHRAVRPLPPPGQGNQGHPGVQPGQEGGRVAQAAGPVRGVVRPDAHLLPGSGPGPQLLRSGQNLPPVRVGLRPVQREVGVELPEQRPPGSVLRQRGGDVPQGQSQPQTEYIGAFVPQGDGIPVQPVLLGPHLPHLRPDCPAGGLLPVLRRAKYSPDAVAAFAAAVLSHLQRSLCRLVETELYHNTLHPFKSNKTAPGTGTARRSRARRGW